MCGFAGFIGAVPSDIPISSVVTVMTEKIHHRGPDDFGCWVDNAAGLALGHRRLAIIDVTPAGRQPMIHPDTGDQLIYNGELYNTEELRKEILK